MTATIVDASSGSSSTANVRYHAVLTDMAESDTIGITVEADTNLHTVPAGGQTLYEALKALAVLVRADGYNVSISKNQLFDQTLHISGAGGASVALTLPVYVVA